MSATRHGVKIEVRVTRAVRSREWPHVPREWFVIDCACGWQSPLCVSKERASALYVAHRKRPRAQRKSLGAV